jgi:hypothetical protein
VTPASVFEHTANDILVNPEAEGVGDLPGNAHAAEVGGAPFHSHDGRDAFRRRPFGPALHWRP